MKHKVKAAINSASFYSHFVALLQLSRRTWVGHELVYYFMAKFRRREALKSITGLTLSELRSLATLRSCEPHASNYIMTGPGAGVTVRRGDMDQGKYF